MYTSWYNFDQMSPLLLFPFVLKIADLEILSCINNYYISSTSEFYLLIKTVNKIQISQSCYFAQYAIVHDNVLSTHKSTPKELIKLHCYVTNILILYILNFLFFYQTSNVNFETFYTYLIHQCMCIICIIYYINQHTRGRDTIFLSRCIVSLYYIHFYLQVQQLSIIYTSGRASLCIHLRARLAYREAI